MPGDQGYQKPADHTALDNRIQIALLASEERQLKHLDIKMKEMREFFTGAFPSGDPSGHRAYHEAQIQLLKERSEAWREIRNKTMAGMIWAVLGVLAVALLEAVRNWMLHGAPK